MWLRRLQNGGVVSPYNKYYEPYGDFNVYTGSIRMPNCTAYAYIRMQEAMRLDKRNPYLINASGGFGNAKTWYSTTPLPKGTELREGAIAVFDGNCGHVASVEKKINGTHAIISESNYDDDKSLRNWKYWQTRECDLIIGQSTISGIGPLIGFIYPDIDDKRVIRNGNKDQLSVNYDYLNVRRGPGLDYAKYDGCFCPSGIYDILDSQEADGYTWYKLDEGYWIAGVEEVEILPKVGDKDNIKVFGLDISEWQRGIDIAQLKQEGMKFAILRAGFTGWGDGVTKHVDDCFEDFYTQCKELDIPVGAYWYSCANTYDKGKAEAKYMIENCLKNKYFELPIAIDVEDQYNQQPAGREAITEAINGFCDYLVTHNYFPIVYANSSWFKNYIGNISWDKWIAQWSTVKPDNCGIWQYSSSEYMAGQRIDSNYMYKDYETYIKEHGLNVYKGDDEMIVVPVERNTQIDQVFIGTDGLRIRDEASLTSEITGYCEENVYYNVIGITENEGYTWYHLGPDAWIAGIDEVEYLPKEEPQPEPDPTWIAPQPVDRDENKDQIYLDDVCLRFRDEPSTESEAMGLSEANVYYNVVARSEQSDYMWYNLGPDAWVAGVEEVKFYPAAVDPEPGLPVPVDQNINVNQVFITNNNVIARKGPSTSNEIIGVLEIGYYNVYDIRENEGYTWYMLDGCWIADEIMFNQAGEDPIDPEPIPDPEPTPEPIEWQEPQGVDRDQSKDQIYVGDFYLNMREEPSLSAKKMGAVEKNSYFDVLDISRDEDYTWYKLGDRAWGAGVDGVAYLPAFVMPQSVDVDESRDQVYIGDVVLKVRFEPSTSSEMMGYIDEFSNYNVFEIVNKSDYTWYKLGDNAYIAQCDDEIQYFPAGSSRKGAELKKLLPQLKNNIDTALVAINANLGNEYYDDLFNKATDLNDFIKDNFDQYAYDLVDDHNYNEVDIIYTTDIHGYWKGYEESQRVQTNFSMDDIKTYENRLLANNIKPLIVNSGDTIHGSERANANYGEDAINAYNNLDFFATVFGNHEFRYNDEGPIFQQQMAKLASAVACNIKYKANGEYVFKPYKTAKIGDVTLGIIGVGFPGPDGGHANLDGFDILTDDACYNEIQKCINELQAKGIQHILCAVHLGNNPDERAGGIICVPSIIANTKGLDVVLPGHSHSMQEAHYETDKSGREVLVAAQPRCDLAYLSILKIKSNGFDSFLIDSI